MMPCQTCISIHTCNTGVVITAKAPTEAKLHKAKEKERKLIHALHKAQDKMDEFEVCSFVSDTDVMYLEIT